MSQIHETNLIHTLSKVFLNILICTGPLSRSFLFGRVWGPGPDVEEASLDSYVHFIRRRLRAVSSRVTVDTVRGVGYRLLDGGTGA